VDQVRLFALLATQWQRGEAALVPSSHRLLWTIINDPIELNTGGRKGGVHRLAASLFAGALQALSLLEPWAIVLEKHVTSLAPVRLALGMPKGDCPCKRVIGTGIGWQPGFVSRFLHGGHA
jgi:hypothetical protein